MSHIVTELLEMKTRGRSSSLSRRITRMTSRLRTVGLDSKRRVSSKTAENVERWVTKNIYDATRCVSAQLVEHPNLNLQVAIHRYCSEVEGKRLSQNGVCESENRKLTQKQMNK